MKKIVLFSLLAFVASSFQDSFAESGVIAVKPAKKLKQPLRVSGKTNESNCDPDVERERCQNIELEREDVNLNLAYKQLLKAVSAPPKQAKLRETERLWLQFVEENCKFEASTFSGGSLEPITYTDCLIRHTKARAMELTNQYAECNSYGAC